MFDAILYMLKWQNNKVINDLEGPGILKMEGYRRSVPFIRTSERVKSGVITNAEH